MIDRVWWMWQMVDVKKRVYGETTLDDVVDFGYAAGPGRRLRELMSVVEGPSCYVYVW